MATETEHLTEQSTTSLVAGIIADVELLVKQQMELARQEIVNDYHKARDAALSYAVAVVNCALGAIILCFALVYLLHWAASPPATDPAWLPLWGCYGIVGLVHVVSGGTLAWITHSKKPIDPVHNPAVEGLKENIDWLTRPK